MKNIFLFLSIIVLLASCEQKKLPIFGQREVIPREIDGKTISDTLYHTIAPFQFVNQDSVVITNKTFAGKVYVADFFFTSCRTICPIMKTQMLRVYEIVKDDPEVLIISHTIDPEHDTVAFLRDYAARLGVKSEKWHFASGQPKDTVYELAQKSYFATAMEDKNEPDGFIHSGAFLLIDRQGRIRGKYDGTKEDDVNRLLEEIKILKDE